MTGYPPPSKGDRRLSSVWILKIFWEINFFEWEIFSRKGDIGKMVKANY